MKLLVAMLALSRAVLALSLQVSSHGISGRGLEEGGNVPSDEELAKQAESQNRRLCVVRPDADGGDDAPAIMKALNEDCRQHSMVVLPGPTYNIKTNMTTEQLDDVQLMLYGRLLWSKDIDYWTSVSMPVGFQNQSTVWYFGGDKVVWDGMGTGTLDGNGQVWYDWARGEGNVARRPMNINLRRLTNSAVRRMRFVQSQMWTMAITYSQNVELDDIYVNSTSSSQWSTLNTDGCDTIFSDRITFRRWFVTNGDDGIALKRNSTNIAIYDSEFRNGTGVAIGSLGQYDGEYDLVANFYARNITLVDTHHVSYLKTWAGTSRGLPPNGGGGGVGAVTNITMEDVRFRGVRHNPFFIWQCENYSGFAGKDCNSSKLKMSQIAWRNVRGTVEPSVSNVGSFQCSLAAGGCDGVEATDIEVTVEASQKRLDSWHCENVHDAKGFMCKVEVPKSAQTLAGKAGEQETGEKETSTGARRHPWGGMYPQIFLLLSFLFLL